MTSNHTLSVLNISQTKCCALIISLFNTNTLLLSNYPSPPPLGFLYGSGWTPESDREGPEHRGELAEEFQRSMRSHLNQQYLPLQYLRGVLSYARVHLLFFWVPESCPQPPVYCLMATVKEAKGILGKDVSGTSYFRSVNTIKCTSTILIIWRWPREFWI